MLLLETHHKQFYNTLMHNLLDVEIYKEKKNVGDYVEFLLPKYLYREQFPLCENAFNDLYNWSNDEFDHELNSLHKLILYNFLEYLSYKQLSDKNFNKKYFNKEVQKELEKIGCTEHTREKQELEKQQYLDINWNIENLFKNTDFLYIEDLNDRGELEKYLSKNKGMIELYYDILPLKIKKQYDFDCIDIYEQIKKLINFIQYCIDEQNLAMMFWENNSPMNEPKIQLVLENFIDAYFYNLNIDINRECSVGSGDVDFKFYKNKKEIILFEIKKANNPNLKFGHDVQLVKYMKSCHCDKAFYLIMCFNKSEYEKAKKFEKDNKSDNIEIVVLDVRLDNKKIIEFNNTSINKNIDEDNDKYFEYINTILNLTKTDDIINYFIKLRENYYKLETKKLKDEYLKKIQELYYKNYKTISFGEKLVNVFYKITETEVNKTMALNLIHNIEFEKDIEIVIDLIIELFESVEDIQITKCITRIEIEDIFKTLKEEFPNFYKLLTRIELDIYLFNGTDKQSNSYCIPTTELERFTLACFYIRENDYKNKNVKPIYVFLYQLGLVLYWIGLNNNKNLVNDFIKATHPHFDSLDENNEDCIVVFADCFAMNIMHNTKYNEYNPFKCFEDVFYQKIYKFFDSLVKELIRGDR